MKALERKDFVRKCFELGRYCRQLSTRSSPAALSKRAIDVSTLSSAPYYQGTDVQGVVDFRLAETNLAREMAMGKLSECRSVMVPAVSYGYDSGVDESWNRALANYFTKALRHEVDPSWIIPCAGTTAALENLIGCLLDPGQGLLVPTPLYPGFLIDFGARSGVSIVPVNTETSSTSPFPTAEDVLNAAKRAKEIDGIEVKCLLLTNPHNPSGLILSPDRMRELMNVAEEQSWHVVSDEIYAGTIFDELDTVFASALSIHQNVHVVTGLSKDFPFAGLRAGCLISTNEQLRQIMGKLNRFTSISADTMRLLTPMLLDNMFIRDYSEYHQSLLKLRHNTFWNILQEEGVKVGESIPSQAGPFVWVDLRHYLLSNDFESEEKLWRFILEDAKINTTRGLGCNATTPGWFRMSICGIEDADEFQCITQRLARTLRSLAWN